MYQNVGDKKVKEAQHYLVLVGNCDTVRISRRSDVHDSAIRIKEDSCHISYCHESRQHKCDFHVKQCYHNKPHKTC